MSLYAPYFLKELINKSKWKRIAIPVNQGKAKPSLQGIYAEVKYPAQTLEIISGEGSHWFFLPPHPQHPFPSSFFFTTV